MLVEPQVAFLDCNDCVKYVYNLEEGKRETYEGEGGERLPIVRTEKPPCESCPKGPEPDLEGKKALSLQNHKSLQIYQQLQATYGAIKLPDHLENCAVFAANMAKISAVYRTSEAEITNRARSKSRK